MSNYQLLVINEETLLEFRCNFTTYQIKRGQRFMHDIERFKKFLFVSRDEFVLYLILVFWNNELDSLSEYNPSPNILQTIVTLPRHLFFDVIWFSILKNLVTYWKYFTFDHFIGNLWFRYMEIVVLIQQIVLLLYDQLNPILDIRLHFVNHVRNYKTFAIWEFKTSPFLQFNLSLCFYMVVTHLCSSISQWW